jgi:hypothetical protein
MSQGEFSPPYEPSQPATASTSTPMAQNISFVPPPPVRGDERALRTDCAVRDGTSERG